MIKFFKWCDYCIHDKRCNNENSYPEAVALCKDGYKDFSFEQKCCGNCSWYDFYTVAGHLVFECGVDHTTSEEKDYCSKNWEPKENDNE